MKLNVGDRYSQAGTHHQLGSLAEAQKEYELARQHLLQALAIFLEFGDHHGAGLALQNIARIYQATQWNELLTDVAQIFGIPAEMVHQTIEAVDNEV